MPFDFSLAKKNAFHFSGHFVPGHFTVDAFDCSFFAAGHVAFRPYDRTPEREDARNVTTHCTDT
jgi:hypothetical protein